MPAPIHNLSLENSIANQYVAELRSVDIQQDPMRFRQNLQRLGEVMAYEISKTMAYQAKTVETPLGEAEVALPIEQPVLATILRAGLPMHQGLLHIFDRADNAFVSAYRRHHKDGSFEINLEYVSCPELEDRTLIIADPMLATGASMAMTIEAFRFMGRLEIFMWWWLLLPQMALSIFSGCTPEFIFGPAPLMMN